MYGKGGPTDPPVARKDTTQKPIMLDEIDLVASYPELFVESKDDPKYKAYLEAVNAYNVTTRAAERIAEAQAASRAGDQARYLREEMGVSEKDIRQDSTNVYKSEARYLKKGAPHVVKTGKYHTPQNGEEPNFYNRISTITPSYDNKFDKDKYVKYIDDLGKYFDNNKNGDYTYWGGGVMSSGVEKVVREEMQALKKLIKNTGIQPKAVASSAEGLSYPIFEKPRRPVFLKGTKEYDVAKKQVQLKEAGLYDGGIDAIWGPKSEAAWSQYEQSQAQAQPEAQPEATPSPSQAEGKSKPAVRKWEPSIPTKVSSNEWLNQKTPELKNGGSMLTKPKMKSYSIGGSLGTMVGSLIPIPGAGAVLGAVGGITDSIISSNIENKRAKEAAYEETLDNVGMRSAILKKGGPMGTEQVEVEGGEVKFKNKNGKWVVAEKYRGPSHGQGGIKVNVGPDDQESLVGTRKDMKIFNRLNKKNKEMIPYLMENIRSRKPQYSMAKGGPMKYAGGGGMYGRAANAINTMVNSNTGPVGMMARDIPIELETKVNLGGGMAPGGSPTKKIATSPVPGIQPKNLMATKGAADGSGGAYPKPKTGMSGAATTALQLLPDAVNMVTGIFGKNKNAPATKINQRAVDMLPNRWNEHASLEKNASDYRGIVESLENSGDNPANKQFAFASKLRANNAVYAMKNDKENGMQTAEANMTAGFDTRQAGFDETREQDNMITDANLGFDGNFAREALGNISNKLLYGNAEKNRATMDRKTMQYYANAVAAGTGLDARKSNQVIDAMFGSQTYEEAYAKAIENGLSMDQAKKAAELYMKYQNG